MKKRLIRTAARAISPRVTTRDLRTAALLAAGTWAGERVLGRKKMRAVRYAAAGLEAAALAIPLGMWVGRKLRGRKS